MVIEKLILQKILKSVEKHYINILEKNNLS